MIRDAWWALVLSLGVIILSTKAWAATDERIEELERKIKILTEELEKLKEETVVPEYTYEARPGLGPAASKVYASPEGRVSIGGYGQTWLQAFINDNQQAQRRDVWDFTRFVLYAGYKFTDRILLNSEIEFEHATTSDTESAGGGSVSVEFAYLDFLLWEPLNARAGLLLIPMGFLNEVHEPTTYFGNERPEVERQILPTTWRENGAGIFGTPLPGLEYRSYIVTSLNAEGFSSSNIRGARQSGNRALAEDFAWVTRVDYTPIPELFFGASVFWGDTGQDQTFAGQNVDANLLLYEFHTQFEYRGWRLRGLFAQGHIGDAAVLSADPNISGPISSRIWGAYGEVGYNILPLLLPETSASVEPFFRFEAFNTQADVPAGFTPDSTKDVRLFTFGMNYKPIPQVVIKTDFRFFDSAGGTLPDEFNIGLGFIF
jgi:hypothetical protein